MPEYTLRTSPLLMTMGIIGIAAGALGLLCGFCSTAGAAFILKSANTGASADYLRYLDREAPLTRVAELAKPVSLMMLSPLLIAGSAAVMLRKGWGRWLVLAFVALLLPVMLFHGIYEVAVVFPASDRYFATPAAAGMPPGAASQMKSARIGVIISVVFWSLVCVVMLGGLFNPVASRDLAPPPRRRRRRDAEDEDDDAYDDDDDRPRRRRRRYDDDDFE